MKPLSQSAACAAKCLFAVMQYMKSNSGTVTTKEINDIIQKNVKFTEWELERAGKAEVYRWRTSWSYNKYIIVQDEVQDLGTFYEIEYVGSTQEPRVAVELIHHLL